VSSSATSNANTLTAFGPVISPVTSDPTEIGIALARSPIEPFGSTGVELAVRVGARVAAATPARVGVGGLGVRVGGFSNTRPPRSWVGGTSNVGKGVTVGMGVRVGRSSGVGDCPTGLPELGDGVIASGVRIEPKPGSNVGVGGTRVPAPAGVDVAILPAAETITTCVLWAPLSGVENARAREHAPVANTSSPSPAQNVALDMCAL
jgi:hypothetical protein